MRVLTLVEPVAIHRPVVTVGTFDGVHVGHAAVIGALRQEAERIGGTSVVVTFDPHPRQIIDGAGAPGLLTTLPEKQWRLKKLGVDVLAVVPFTQTLRQVSAEAFVETHLVNYLQAHSVIVGYDHGFGKDRQGGFETMQGLGNRFGFGVQAVPPTLIHGEPVSSTRIRQAVLSRDFTSVVQLLGSGYPVWGRVSEGYGRGRGLGFPTANLSFDSPAKLLPPLGVYAGCAFLPEPHHAVVNFGKRPTFNAGEPAFEVHLIGYGGDLYEKTLEFEICAWLRDERTFESRDALVHQIQRDIEAAKAMLSPGETTILRR